MLVVHSGGVYSMGMISWHRSFICLLLCFSQKNSLGFSAPMYVIKPSFSLHGVY